MKAWLVINRNKLIFATGKTPEQTIKNLNHYLKSCGDDDRYETSDFDGWGNLINPDGSFSSEKDSNWRLIEADISVNKFSEIEAETEFTEI